MNKQLAHPEVEVSGWITAFNRALENADPAALASLFEAECYWRDFSGLTWSIMTFVGDDKVVPTLLEAAGKVKACDFRLEPSLVEPKANVLAGKSVIEATFRFETDNGPGIGVLRLGQSRNDDGIARAWIVATQLDMDLIRKQRVSPEVTDGAHTVDFSLPAWPERRAVELEYSDREPDVLVVGGGHAGLSAAAELKQLGYDALIIDRLPRVGDCWRLRYDGLKLHNKFPVNHLRYMPYPSVMPQYLPKDKVANWFESYVDALDLNFWTGTALESASYDFDSGLWTATVSRPDGTTRALNPKHIVMATSVSGTPNIPEIPTIEKFAGKVLHSSEFGSGKDWTGQSVLVIGSATSAHDVCQQLHAHGAKATMVQRGPTLVMSVEPSSELYEGGYSKEGAPHYEILDLLNSTIPFPVVKPIHQEITKKVKEIEEPLYNKLRAVGFQLEFGEDETGWPFKFRNYGGGYYLNVGCSDLIADGEVGLIQASDIETYLPDGLKLKDGTEHKFDAIVFGTGFKGHDHMVRQLFGDDVAERVGTIWGISPETHELRNMWTKTGQPGLWFTGGAFSMSRQFSRIIALQIDAIETGRLEK